MSINTVLDPGLETSVLQNSPSRFVSFKHAPITLSGNRNPKRYGSFDGLPEGVTRDSTHVGLVEALTNMPLLRICKAVQ